VSLGRTEYALVLAGVGGALAVLALLAMPLADMIVSLENVLPGWGAGGLLLYSGRASNAPSSRSAG
jgi:hypothetical protein